MKRKHEPMPVNDGDDGIEYALITTVDDEINIMNIETEEVVATVADDAAAVKWLSENTG